MEQPEVPAFLHSEKRRKAFVARYKSIRKLANTVNALLHIALYTAIFIAGYAGYEYLAEKSKVVYVREDVEVPHMIVFATVTAYTSSVDETDEDPFITASGSTVRHGTLACPSKYEFGTVIEIEGVRYICEDRMNKRYRQTERFDVWKVTKQDAFAWGNKKLSIKVYLNN